MVSAASLEAYLCMPGRMTFCSWETGWRSLLVRCFDDPQQADPFSTAPTADQQIVLVTDGCCSVESFGSGRWRKADYRPGTLGFNAPHEAARLRWSGLQRLGILQLHLPAQTMQEVDQELRGGARRTGFPNQLAASDPMIAEMLCSLAQAAQAGAPDLYAETGAQFLAAHILLRHGTLEELGNDVGRDKALRHVDEALRADLAASPSLETLASVAGMSRFQLLRAARAAWAETPLRRLTRLRIQLARRLLRTTGLSIVEIALECGYGSSAHFATSFRRHVGQTPSDYRRG